MGDDLATALLDRRRSLEVEERDRLFVGGDHDVEHVQVVEGDATCVHRLDRLLDQPVNAQRPGRVVGDGGGIRGGGEQRMAFGEEGVERPALQEVHDEEAVVAEREPVAHLGHDTESGHPLQGVLLPGEPGHGVRPVGGEPRVRPALLEDDPASVAGVDA